MPSEAQSQEPRDRGPPPPVTRAGRSAQLAKAAATSPTPERRSRGRPRRDGGAPPPPPPPPPKPRKKGRSRGRAQVEDEESMDATEKNPPEKTEVKEKSTGWRRSTPRRKSNANPEPDPEHSRDRLSPDPEPDPNPTVPEPSPEPAPSIEEGDRDLAHLAPSADLPPTADPQPPSPSPNPEPDPDPDPEEEGEEEEEDQPTPMEVDCTFPMETEDVHVVSPMETTSALSPCSSPPVSPCPRLEDEDSLSPLFQRSLSEESGSSPTPSLGHTKKRLKQCAFCYRGDEPPLGQGHLVVFGPTPGYIPLHILNRRASSDRDNDCHDHCYRGDQAPPMCSSPEQSEAESSSEFMEQLGPIGLPCDIDVQSLFDPTGQCCAHLQCAAWSEGVCRGEGQSLLYVDKAIDSGSTQVCVFCRRLGASLRCRETGCGRSYHFPCAAAAGAHQDWNERHTMCTRHAHMVSSQCVSCSGGPEGGSLLMCCCCGSRFHGSCLDPPVAPSPLCRAGWQCPQCQVCQNCRLRGDDSVLLVCERCDKAYHTKCLNPPVEDTPTGGWHCRNCRVCRCCGVRSSGQWANHPFLCESCDPALPCSLCGHAPDLYSPQDYLTCTCCYRCVHTKCTVQTGEGRTLSEGYVCSACRPQEEELSPSAPVPHSPSITESLSPSKALSVCLSQPSGPSHTEDPPISPIAHTPVQFTCSELPQSPSKTISTTLHHSPSASQACPTDFQHSPVPSHHDLTEQQQSLATSHPDLTEREESLASSYPYPTEPLQSPTPSHPDSTPVKESLTPSYPDPAEPLQCPAPSHPDLTERQESLAPSHPDPAEPLQSPSPSHPDLTEQQNLAPSYPDLTERQESLALSHTDPAEPPQSPAPSHPDPTEQESPAPSHPDPIERQESPAPSHPDPIERQESPAPSHPDAIERQESPATSHPDPIERQESPATSHPDPTERLESPATSHPDPTERQSPTHSHLDPAEPRPHSPPPSHPYSTKQQQSPASLHLHLQEHQCTAPSHPNPAELQQSPLLSHSDPAELKQSVLPYHLDPTEQEQSPVPSRNDSAELHQRPHPDPIELEQIPVPSTLDAVGLQSSPAPSQPDIMEWQPSPASPHANVAELHQSPAPPHAESTENRRSPAPSHPEPVEHSQSTATSYPDAAQVCPSPAPSHPEPAELQPSPPPPHAESTENLQSPAQSHPEPAGHSQNTAASHPDPIEHIQSPAPFLLEPTEHLQNPGPSHPESAEKLQCLALSHSGIKLFYEVLRPSGLGSTDSSHSPAHLDLAQSKQNSVPSRPSQTQLQEAFNLDPSEQKSHTTFYQSPVELEENNIQSHSAKRELQQSLTSSSPTNLLKSQAHEITMQDQHNPRIEEQLSPVQSDHNTILTLNSAEDQKTPVQGSPVSYSGHSSHSPPPSSQTQVTLHRPPIHPNPAQFSPPYQSPAQDSSPQLHQPPTSLNHAPQSPPSPVQVGTSILQSSTQDGESTLDQESPESHSPEQQDISTLDQDISTLSYRVTQIPFSHAPQRSISAPCSPSSHPVRPVHCSLSQPASPIQANALEPVRPLHHSIPPFQKNVKECTQSNSKDAMEFQLMQMSPDLEGQTLESSSTSDLSTMPLSSLSVDSQLPNQLDLVQSSTGSLHCSSPIDKPATPTPESLVHISTSADHSSLTLSPCADIMEEDPPPASPLRESASNDSPSYCGDASPKCIIAGSGSASPLHVSEMYDSQLETSPVPVDTHPIYSFTPPHDEAVDHLSPQMSPSHLHSIPVGPVTYSSPVHIETNNDCSPVDPVKEISSIICSPAEQTQILTGISPKHRHLSGPLHDQTTCSPVQMSPLQTPASCSPPHCKATDISPTNSSVSHSLSCGTSDFHSPPRSSPAGHASPVYIQSTSNCALSGPIQRPSLSDSPAQASVGYVSPHHSPAQASPDPAPDNITIMGLTNVSSLVNTVASSIIQTSVLPIAAQVHSSLDKPLERADQTSPMSASSLSVDLTSFSPDQPSQCPDRPASPQPVLDRSTVEVHQSTDAISLIHQKTTTPDQASIQASPSQASPMQASPSDTSPSQAILTQASPLQACPTQASPSQASPSQVSPTQASPLQVSPLQASPSQASPTQASPSQASPTQTSPTQASPTQTSPTQASPIYVSSIHTTPSHASPPQGNTAIPSTSHNSETPLSPISTLPFQASSAPSSSIGSPVCTPLKSPCPSHISPVQPEKISCPEPSSSLRLEASPGPVCLLHYETRCVHDFTGQETSPGDVPCDPTSSPEGHQEISETQMECAASVGMAVAEEMKRNAEEEMKTEDLKSEEKPDERTEQGEVEDQENQEDLSSSRCLPSELQLTSDLPEDHQSPPPHSPLLPTPYSALASSPSPPGAGSKEASPCSPPSGQDQNQSQSLFEHTKDKHQSQAEPLAREEEPIQEKEGEGAEHEDQSDVEEEEGEEEEEDEEEDPVSPVLDLDHSLDMEVMELMATHLSSPSPPPLPRRGKGRSLRPPPCSSRPSDDLSIRLRQSPFSTEASPETSPNRAAITPPPLSPLTPPLRASPVIQESPPLKPQPPPTTVIPLTPKIGMGKPAITKRKFSPGRARVKQGSWWSQRRAVSPLSSSQDSTGEGGWDSPKPRPLDSPLWSMKVGRSSGFPGRRRSRGGGVGGGRGGRGRSRLKTQDSLAVSPVMGGFVESFQMKEDEENSMHNTVVMFSTSDHFTLKQDMCVVCGSFGQGAEGRLLACSQCGQCYHPYCVNVKITRVVLTKGWRCLECTVCEACGEASDPGRLLLCDDCDISYHTYCLKPPLHTVPKGAWKCKWCVWCVQCGSTSPGLHCEWQNNYSRCGPCSSLSRCPLCQRQYSQDDLILQCQQCDRWVHAVCQGLTTEDEVEFAADEGFDCSLCKTHGRSSYGRSDTFDAPYMAQIISRTREPDTKTYTQDGVCLTESGLSHLQSLVEPLSSPRRYRRCKPKLKLRIINQNSVSVLQTPEPEPSTEQEHRGDLDCDLKSDSSPERDHAHDDDVTKEPEVADGNKKRKRKPYRPGIGGFMVRQRGGKAGGPSRIKLCRKDSTEMLPGRDEGLLDADVSMETAPSADQTMEKVKKRYRKKKTKLEETFPSYLQEAFFGRILLDRSRQTDRREGPEATGVSQPQATTGEMKGPAPGLHHGPTPQKPRVLPMSEEALVDLSAVLNTDPHILATGHTGQFQVERSPSPFAGLDIGSMGDPSMTTEPTGRGGRGQRAAQEEPLDAILSPELDKMVSDGAILSRLYKIPELEGKDVEEVFTAVLSPNSSNNQSEQSQHTAPGSKTHVQFTAGAFPRLPLMNGLMGASSHFPNAPMMPSGVQAASGFRMPPPTGPAPAPPPLLPPGPPSGPAAANQGLAEGEQDVMSTAQRSTLKWEKEETLGELATVAPVLYCNTNFPQLREHYPDWSTRVKQIAKLWRKASSQDRAPFVQKARDNRAAQRINKVQLSNDPLKRHPPTQPPPGPYDPISMETEVPFKDPLRPKESEQEQEWKFRQGEVNDRWGAGKKRQENLKSPTDKDCPYQASVAGGGKEALQMRQKSKQLAKIEATQKLEQVKIEQLQQQRQQQLMACQRLATGTISPETGSRSPMTPTQQPLAGGNASPLQPRLLLQGAHGSGSDDVFLRPQAPPPSGYSSLPHSPHPSSPLHQPPSSPQMFSPPSSRPSSPWDPYSKVVGTPRAASSQSTGSQTPQNQQRRNSLSASPAHDALGSPAPSPDSKASDVSRSLGPQTGLQQIRPGMLSPPSGSGPDLSARLVGLRAAEPYQRTPVNSGAGRPGDLVQAGVFKAPMPPQLQLQQEAFTGGRRDMSRPTDLGLDLSFPSSPLSGLGSPHRSPYAQTPGTPRPDYTQQMSDPFSHQSPLTSRPSPDPYANPQTPGTPRPHSDPAYLPTPPALRLDQFNQQSTNQRPSPSHPNVDPYSSSPGTPRPAADRFPRSPGTQPVGTPRPSPDPYTQQPSTPRPQKAPEPFSQTPVEGFTTQPARSSSSPRAPGLTGDMVALTTPHQLQQSPGRPQQQHQDLFPRTPSSQTPKHTGMSEDSGFTDPFEQSHIIAGPQMEKATTNEMSVLGVASLDGPMSVMPQLGDSEEKLRQRQRLRQLILRQQQQKSALRQEKGLQEVASGSGPAVPPAAAGPGSATPRQWSQDDSSSASSGPPADLFGRPPPPYPGTVRPGAPPGAPRFPAGFPGEQQRSFPPSEGTFPRQSVPREMGVRGPALRFGVPPVASTGLQDSFLRPPQCSVPGSGLTAAEGVPIQIRRPMPAEFTGIRPLPGPSAHPHMMPGVPQPFLPRSLPIQQHSIMGQPYIELRHRVPENRLRLPFSLPIAPDPEVPLLHPRDPHPPAGQAGPGQQMAMEQLNPPQDQQHLGHTTALAQTAEPTLPGADGIEEHLEGEDSAVKDLEDVEVKDLVDLNLNLDPEDGKEDLDLGPNDLHLDDFLLSGKFDLIAYADPELNLEDKKDMFNEELDLGETVDDKDGTERRDGGRKTDGHAHPASQIKQEVKDGVKIEGKDGTSRPTGAEGGGSAPPSKDKLEDSGSVPGALPVLQDQALSSGLAPRVLPPVSPGQQPVFQQRPFGPPSTLVPPHPQGLPVSPHPALTSQGPTAPPRLLLTPHTQTPHLGTTSAQVQLSNQNQAVFLQDKSRPLLLEEQPLLLQDLLDQERQEQQQQKQMQALIRQRSTSEPVLPNMDFDSISDPIMKAKMVALKGINKVMTQGNLGLNPMVINRFQQGTAVPAGPVPEATPHMVGQDEKLKAQMVRPNPPSFGSGFVNESQRRQYEEWLGETQQLLQMQQRLLEDQITAHRKTKKALSAKQRTAKKAGRPFAEEDASQLRYITEQQGAVQKQLEQIRKQQKDHAELIEDYRTKQQQQQRPPAPPVMPSRPSLLPQTMLTQPIVPMQPHPSGPAPPRVPGVRPGWTPGGGVPGVMGQRMPGHLPPQIPPTLPSTPQVPTHTQTGPSAGFAPSPRGPTGGPNGAAGDGAASTPQVKFDDNNPFSEGFQERERRERLREQQERQRVQLMHEVERHRALQQRLELEQQGLLGAPIGPGARVAPPSGPGVAASLNLSSSVGEGLSQMPFFSSELPQDFLQSPPASRPPTQLQGQQGAPFPPQGGPHQGFSGGPHPTPVSMPSPNLQIRPKLLGPGGPSVQGQGCPAGLSAAGLTPSHPPGHRFGPDSASSSPSTPLPPSFPGGSGGPASLIQLYSDIIPDDKPKKKRCRKKDGDDAGGGARTPLSSHSDDITAPPTPSISDTACSTPTRGSLDQSDLSFPQISALSGLAPSSELERQLSVSAAAQERTSILGVESQRAPLYAARLEVKEERVEGRVCGEGVVKMEEGEGFSSPPGGADGGKELLRHLLKDKTSPATTPSPTRQAPPTGLAPPAAHRQLSMESARSEDEDGPGFHGNMVGIDGPGLDLMDPSNRKKPQRCKRQARPDKERAPPKYKRRKREDEDKTQASNSASSSSTDPLTHLRQLSVLPLMEPVLGVDLSLFPPYGSSSLGRDSRLSGSFGNACLDGVTDYYSQLIYKQNNLSNPPTPPASLPPTPPPVARQNLVNGFATTEELARKDITEQEVKGVSGLKQKGEELLALNHASRTVDVPASLPTPPHNNQEELRVQDMSDRDSPDGFIPSSSPESVADVEVSRYPDLSFIKLEPPSPCPSPTIPIMPCAQGKGSAVKQEVKAEPNHQGPPSCSNTDLVTIAITLNPVAAQNVPGVMAAVAQLLRLPVPVNYHLNRPVGPERSSLALLAGVRVPLMQASTGNRTVRPPANNSNAIRLDYSQPAAARPECCSHCKVLLGNGVRIVKELKQEGQPRPGPSLVFCSPTCSARHMSNLQNSAHKVGSTPIPQLPTSKAQHQYTNNMSSIAVHTLPHNTSSAGPSPSPPLSFPPASAITMETKPRMDSLKVKVKLKPRPRAVPGGDDPLTSRHGKRMKSSRWRRWSISIALSRGPCIPNEAVAMPTEEELKNLGACLRPDPLPKDQRRCCFCHQQGDGLTDGPARLLNLDLDLWVHLNCALWSSEVYETQAGALINVELALRRGLTLRCAHCQQTGATSGCNRLRCTNTYHFTCALQAHCTFFKDKTMLCQLHKPRTGLLSGDRSSSASPSSTPGPTPDPVVALTCDPYDSELRCFSVFRRVYVQRDEARQIAAVVQRGERQHTFRVGSLLFRAVGRLLPHQLHTFHSKTAIFPVGYHANRIYWSMRHSNRRCKYMCYIEDKDGEPLFKVRVVEKGHEDLILTGPTPKAVWDQILDPVAQIRSSSGTLKLFPVYLKGADLFGLTSSAVTRIIESLPGVEACERYTFRYGRNPLMEWPLAFNPSGSARSEPKASQAKRPNLLTSVAPRCQGSVGSIVGLVPGVISLSPGETMAGAHQGRHSKSSQYRRMKAEWKSNVYLARSGIQGLGLYAARDIEKCTMVIEYIGTIIRSEVANRKERLYESQNRGVYMFRIDNDYVIDATITGGPARYINHSCAPNCITEVVTVEKENKIIISSCRRIQRGEELCYDYKFDLEDDQHKIPCHCGAVNCRKWMN